MNRLRCALFLGASLIIAACSAPAPKQDLHSELESMYETDQSYREKVQELTLKKGTNVPELPALLKKQQAIDEANLKRLDEIVATNGWPAPSILGDKASTAAFLIVQHADHANQVRYLPVVKAAVSDGKARPDQLALLEDRVLVGDGKMQRYGSQLRPNGKGGLEFFPIEDEAHVDERRKAVGLEPLAEYAKRFGLEYKTK
jgi:hypothetical protein